MRARKLSVCSCASVKIWAELSEPSVSKQSACLLAPPQFIDSLTRCVCAEPESAVSFLCLGTGEHTRAEIKDNLKLPPVH